jgi:hypothetical protein
MELNCEAFNAGRYRAKAIYYEHSDSLEYVRRDMPAVYRRVDEQLTLILDMDSRQPVGFKLKGYRHFFLRHLQGKFDLNDQHFLKLIDILQQALSVGGDAIFEAVERQAAYRQALEIAKEDDVLVDDLPKVARV